MSPPLQLHLQLPAARPVTRVAHTRGDRRPVPPSPARRTEGAQVCPTQKFKKRVTSTNSSVSTSLLAPKAGQCDSLHQVTAQVNGMWQEGDTLPAPTKHSVSPQDEKGRLRARGSGRPRQWAGVWVSTGGVVADSRKAGCGRERACGAGSGPASRDQRLVSRPPQRSGSGPWRRGTVQALGPDSLVSRQTPVPGPGPQDLSQGCGGPVSHPLHAAQTLQVVLARAALDQGSLSADLLSHNCCGWTGKLHLPARNPPSKPSPATFLNHASEFHELTGSSRPPGRPAGAQTPAARPHGT